MLPTPIFETLKALTGFRTVAIKVLSAFDSRQMTRFAMTTEKVQVATEILREMKNTLESSLGPATEIFIEVDGRLHFIRVRIRSAVLDRMVDL